MIFFFSIKCFSPLIRNWAVFVGRGINGVYASIPPEVQYLTHVLILVVSKCQMVDRKRSMY